MEAIGITNPSGTGCCERCGRARGETTEGEEGDKEVVLLAAARVNID